ncbi:MFS transporter [Streptomyces sp. URMC 129]|uniref:MFS transporter n=1 Tax=Streptomyces sp. URMC 129 TaxID=3423407 RepID=UPI003F1E4485
MTLPASAASPATARRGLIVLFAVACGVGVANIYLAQPLVTVIGDDLGVSDPAAGVAATLAQAGYATGILLLVPLGDLLRPRRLITALLLATSGCLLVAAAAPGLPLLLTASFAAAACTVVPQILIPLATRLTPPDRAGRTVATLATGLYTGLFGSRVLGGLLGEAAGWRAVYLGAAVVTAATALVLRQACALQFCWFSVFIAAWTVIVLHLTGPGFGWSTAAAGLSGLVGLAAGVLTPLAGPLAERHGGTRVLGAGVGLAVAAVAVLAVAGRTVAGLAAGMFALTLGIQIAQSVNQARVLGEATADRSSANTVFIAATFLGGSFGAAVGQAAHDHAGWPGFVTFGATMICLAALRLALTRRRDEGRGDEGRGRQWRHDG